MKHKRTILISFKVFFGLLGISSIIQEVVVLNQRGVFDGANFFSFFTILSNILAAIALLTSAFFLYKNRRNTLLNTVRGATTLYMALTGVVFSLLLSNLPNLTAVPWDNVVLHYIIPAVMLVDWLVDSPDTKFSTKRILSWLVFPVLYMIYSLIRGAIVGWYPYPFLNPEYGGYSQVLLVSFFITIFSVSAAFLLARTSNGIPRLHFK